MSDFFRADWKQDHAEDDGAQPLTEHSYVAWAKMFSWEHYRSDLVLEVSHVLTEPTAPTACLKHEITGVTLFRADEDTIERAIDKVVKKFVDAAKAGELPSPEEIRNRHELSRDRARRYVKSKEQSIREFNGLLEGGEQ